MESTGPLRNSQLWVFHRILIRFAMLLGIALAAWGWNDGARESWFLAGSGLTATVGLGIYLRWFNAKVRGGSGQVDE